MRKSLIAALGIWSIAAPVVAAPTIVSYTVTGAPGSGFGSWSYTPTTLNDGIIPTSNNNNLLSLTSALSINFTLDAAYTISDISILSAYLGNYIPGNLYSAVVTIGSTSATVFSSGFGPACFAFSCNEGLTLPSSLSSLATSSFTLSGFVSQGAYAGYTALGEVVVNGASAAVPEPASWALMIGGFGLVGASLRRRSALAA